MFGAPLEIGGMKIKNPTIQEIIDYGENRYEATVGLFMLKPSDMMVILDDNGIDYTKVTNYDLFIILTAETISPEENSSVRDNLFWLTGVPDFSMVYDKNNDMLVLRSESTGCIIDRAVYNQIRSYLYKINVRKDEETYNPGNEATKSFLIKEERRKMKRNKKKVEEYSNLANVISCVVFGSHGSITYNNVKELNIWQLYEGFARINKIKLYDFNMIGYYSGSIKASDFKKSLEKIDWTKSAHF